MHDFNPDRYDDKGLLKLSAEFYLVLAFLLRPVLVWIISLTERGQDHMMISTIYPSKYDFFYHVAAAVPALIVAIVLSLRREGAMEWLFAIWKRGKFLLWTTWLAEVALTIYTVKVMHFRFEMSIGITLLLHLWVAQYLWQSKDIPTYFSEWPRPDEPEEDVSDKSEDELEKGV